MNEPAWFGRGARDKRWRYGYVSPHGQRLSHLGETATPTFSQYNRTTFLLPTDLFVLSRVGVGTLGINANVVLPGLGGLLITTNGTELFPGFTYGAKTAIAALSATLPPLSTVLPGAIVIVEDVDNNAGTNNFTVNAFGTDQISSHGALALNYVIGISNTFATFMADSTAAPYLAATQWTAIGYGQ